MKKSISLPLFVFIVNISVAQNLYNWKHYYAPVYYSYDIGNYLAAQSGGEIIAFDKSTYAITHIPFPSSMRELNPHNTQLYDSSMMQMQSHMPQLRFGPDNSLVITSMFAPSAYKFDGVNWLPVTTYQGFNFDSISFLPSKGGNNYFISNNKLYKYDGSSLSFFDLSNSPFDPAKYYYQNTSAGGDIFLSSQYDIAIYHNSTWSVYDTTFFNVHYLYSSSNAVNSSGDFSFVDGIDSTLNIFSNASGNWSSFPVPPAVIHLSGLQVYVMYYDSNGDLWLTGNGIYCRFDGSQFYDYYNNLVTLTGSTNFYLSSTLSGNNVLIEAGTNDFIYDPAANSGFALPADPQAKLTGNWLLPSIKDGAGNIWIGSYGWGQQNGLMKFDGYNWSYPPLDTQGMYGGVFAIARDTGNSIVFGCGDLSSNGLVQLSDTNFVFLTPAYTYQIKDIAIDQNHHYWFGGSGAGTSQGLMESNNGTLTTHSCTASSNRLYAVEIDTLSNKWASFDSYDGVYKFNGTWTNYNKTNSPLPNDTVIDIKIDSTTNSIWFCTSGGFAKLHNGVWSVLNMSNSPLPSNDAEYVYFGDDSTTWFATENGFASLRDTTWNVYTVNNCPLLASDIESMVIDDNCNIWLCADGGLYTATFDCGITLQKSVTGTALQSNNTPAANALIYVYKLNSAATDWKQVENIFTDSQGHFSYFTNDSGQYSFMIAENKLLFPGQLPAYEDSSLVIQQAAPVNMITNGIYPVTIKMQQKVASPGSISLNGRLQSLTERTGSVRLLLMLNNQPVATVTTNVDGSFRFDSIAAATYTIWVDKMGLNNLIAPSVVINSSASWFTWYFDLYTDHLSLSPLGINDQNSGAVINVFPNPFTEQISVSIQKQNLKHTTFQIWNLLGQPVFNHKQKCSGNTCSKTVDLSFLPSGIYMLDLIIDGERTVRKIVKE
ncbi:MAG: T9SS type A sorting domain-containing protein [Bacteroidia bacterium]